MLKNNALAGRAIVKGDSAQQELRIAAYYSRDKNMLGTFAVDIGFEDQHFSVSTSRRRFLPLTFLFPL